jgi:hypothetical protein
MAGGANRVRGKPKFLAAWVVLALPCAGHLPSETARAADSTEMWPELSLFYKLSPATRIYLDGSYSRGMESNVWSGAAAAYLDVSLKPIKRKQLQSEDWQRSRYLWTRVGYTRVFDVQARERNAAEDRGVVSFYSKAPLPAQVWVEARVRADLRWIGGDYSTRYRFRLEATRETMVFRHTVVPYFNVEWFYDGRYDAWARTLYQGGAEVTVTEHFRWEAYLGYQVDRHPRDETLNAFGLVAKWYY